MISLIISVNQPNLTIVDGTFATCPRMFKQLWMIHAQIDIQVIPIAFSLLPGATKAIYTCVFSILCRAITLLSLANNDKFKKTPPQLRQPTCL
ncbi:hypothetical protein DSO57_1036196 [Entomophthora muscae]|uniref:Uncharacterized protein n=1 Tax=Entomophthora muscae TaxID=34485 RepID=A0ACC2U958_9FUNG|nr:hypothetical protein DSO57_1036196 [Entomophthora muscae]